MEATQMISDSILESDEEENEEENENKRGRPLAKLCILKNTHIPETELPLYLGDNVLGRDPNTCTLPLLSPSISKQHATICISTFRRRGGHGEVDIEALIWDQGSMNGTRKGRLKLTPNVRYALSERDSLVVADIPCQYVSCAVDTVSSQGDVRTPVSKSSGVNARLPDALGEKGVDTSTGSKKCVNGGTKARGALPDQEDTRETPVRASCLSVEKTPTQPQGTLVPESDSDSDGERGDRRRKALVSDSDSHKSSPNCSTFLSPTGKCVPESPITPYSSTKSRPARHVSFSKEETDVDVGQQQPDKKKALAIVDDSEEEEERAALGGRTSEESGQHMPAVQDPSVSLTREDELPVSSPAVSTNVIPALNMDSDTDVEGEEEGVASAGAVALNTKQQEDQPPNTAQLHMDSDTDVDEDDDKVPKPAPSSADHTKPPRVISVIQPEGITMDSDTDVDDDDAAAAVSDGATKANPTSPQSTHTADSAPSTQVKDFHLDSDTDVDEDEEEERGTNNKCPKIDETPTRLDIKSIGPESAPAGPSSLHLDSDTDDEAVPAPAFNEPSAVTEPRTTADAGAGLDILSDSDTDVEGDSPLVKPDAVSALSVGAGTTSEVLQADSDADTDVDESSVPPAGDGVKPADLEVDSDTDVDEKEEGLTEAGDGRIPSLGRENTPGMLVPLLLNCSTPVQESAGDVECMETQAFLSPSSGPLGCAVAPAERSLALSSCSDSQEDDFVVAETQSFILQTRDRQGNPPEDHTMEPTQAFGLESSGDERGEQAQALATESTQAFVSAVRDVNLEETQAYADRTSLENEATQAYGEEEPARCSETSARKGQVDFALEATQAYISEPCSDSEDESDEEERKNAATAQTLDFSTSYTVAMAETQPMSACEEEEESLDEETEEVEEHGKAAQPQKRHLSEALSVAETQPMATSGNEESDDEELIPGPRKRKAKPLQLEDTQTNSELSLVETQPMRIGVAETQPMATSGNEESDDEERSQTVTNSELSAVETQPMSAGEDGESDEEDSIPGPRKRKAKARQLEEDETQPLSIPEVAGVETQPVAADEDSESDDEGSIIGPRKRRAQQLQSQEEETQPLTISEPSPTRLQPQRGKGRQTEAGTSGSTVRGRRGSRARLREEEEEQEECSEPPKRQTRGKSKALPTFRGRRGKPRLDEEESEEEEEVEQAKLTRGKKSMRQKDNKEAMLKKERNNLMKEQEKAREEQDKLERERKKEEQERLQAENAERSRLEQERAEKERIERERKEQEEKERAERAQTEKEEQLERERKDKEEKERLECEKAKREEKERLEREEKERIEKERKEKEERERLQREKAEKEEKERFEREEKERIEKERKEKERLEREKAEKEEKEGLEREEKERIEKERKEKEEKERLEKEKRELEERLERERKEQEHQARLEREAKEREERERVEKEKQEKEAKENKEEESKTPARGRRAARKTIAAPSTTEPEQGTTVSTNDDGPARRTRSRSNSSNSVSSERSASSESRGRGRGRGAKRTSGPPQPPVARGGNRRRTVAAERDISPQGVRLRSNSTTSHNSEISSCSVSSQSRERGGRQRGRGRKTEVEPDSVPAVNSKSGLSLASKPTARGRNSRKAEESSNEVPHEDDKDSQQASTTRGRQRANANVPETAADKEDPANQERSSEEFPTPKRNVRGRGQKSETVEAPVAPAVSDGDEAKEIRKGRKRALEAETEENPSCSSKVFKGKEKAQTKEAAAAAEAKDDIPVQAKRKGRASIAQANKNAKDSPAEVEEKEESEKMEEETVRKRGRGRTSVAQKKKIEEQESGTSVDQNPRVEAPEPQTPTSSASRKRHAPADSSPVAKSPRSSSASPASSGRSRAATQAYKVLFTGVVDEAGERVLARLGGGMAKGVADMNYLVTDKVRRTVKFLCAVAKGIPIVTTHWLEKSGKAGGFLSPNAFVVKDPEQEKKFNFCLQESLRIASSQPLLQGYEIHVTKSVKPEPAQMKDIILCSGATFLPKMPSSHKPQTVVISCEEDLALCGPALSASLPVVTAEFILTGILQQKLDLQAYALSAPTNTPQPAGGRGRGRKKT